MRSSPGTESVGRDEPFTLGECRVDPESNSVARGDEVLRLEPKAMQVLMHLASRAGRVVTRTELEETVWTGMVVGPDALTNSIIKLRKVLGDDARSARYIETIPKTGYRLIAPIRSDSRDSDEPPLERKLAAILYADVEGYSRLTGEDEERTHRSLSAQLNQFARVINTHNGTVVHYAGDAVLAEFETVTAALGAAVEVQREFRAREETETDAPPVRFRIGINVGEVIVDRNDIYGDGVNVAARLEDLADPGGVCISESVRTAVGNKLPLDYEFLGEKAVKNIAEPVRAYRVLFYPSERRVSPLGRRFVAFATTAAAVGVIVVAAHVFWQRGFSPVEPAAETSSPAPAIDDKPAIAVLPFASVNVNPEEEYFADGMTDDLITDLSKISGLYVIARNSVFAYKNRPINVSEIGRELGAQYILEGSIRRADERVRINVQLVDSKSGRHLWAERFDRRYEDFFSLQNDVVAQVVTQVAVTLTDNELERIERPPTASLEAYDYYLRAEQAGYIGDLTNLRDTMVLYEKSIELDPEFADAYAGLARAAVEIWRQDMNDLMSGAEARARAYESAERALVIDPSNGRAYSVLAMLQLAQGHHDAAIASARRAVALGPGNYEAHLDLGLVLAYSGEAKQAVAAVETAMRLNPKPTPDASLYAGVVFFMDGQYERAVEALSRARAVRSQSETLWTYLAAAHAFLGHLDEAKSAIRSLNDILPVFSVEYFRTRDSYFRRVEDLEKFLHGLKNAGLPDWPYGFQASEADRLHGDELLEIALGNTWIGRHANGTPFLQQISESGVLAYRSRNSIRTGTVSIRDDKLCHRIEGTTLDQEMCGPIYRNPAGTAETQNEFVALTPDSVRYFSLMP